MAVISVIQAVFFVVSVIYQQQQARKAAERQRQAQIEADARADAAKGLKVVSENEAATLKVPYGRNFMGGARVYTNTLNSIAAPVLGTDGVVFKAGTALDAAIGGTKHEFMMVQQAICVGGINAIYDVDIDGKRISGEYVNADGEIEYDVVLPTAFSFVQAYSHGARVHVYPTGGVVCPWALANDPTLTNAIFSGICYSTSIFRINRDDPQFNAGIPVSQYYLEGMRVYDIEGSEGARTLSAAKTYSNNPALCLLDYLINTEYGRGLALEFIDLDSFYKAKEICDVVVQADVPLDGTIWRGKGGTRDIKRYECNLALDTGKSIRDNIEIILDCMNRAELVWSGGVYRLNIQHPYVYDALVTYPIGTVVQYDNGLGDVSVYEATASNLGVTPAVGAYWVSALAADITDDDIIRDGEISISWPNAQNRLNFATVRFLNEARDFAEETVAWPPKTGIIDGPGAGLSPTVWSGVTAYNRSYKVTYGGDTYQLAVGINRVSAVTPDNDPAWILYDDSTVYSTFLAADSGVPLETEIFATGISDYYHALAKAEQMVRESRDNTAYKLPLSRSFIHLEPGDLVRVTSDVLNIPGELMYIDEVQPDNKGVINIGAYKLDAANLAWNAQDDEIVPIRNLYDDKIPNVVASSILHFPENPTVADSPGFITWDRPDDARINNYVIYTADAYAGANTDWVQRGQTSLNRWDLPNLNSGHYVVTVVSRAKNGNMADKTGWPLKGINLLDLDLRTVRLRVYTRSVLAPSVPSHSGTSFDFTTMTLVPPSGWHTSPQLPVDGVSDSLWYAQTDVTDTETSHIKAPVTNWNRNGVTKIEETIESYTKTLEVFSRNNPPQELDKPTGGSYTFPSGPMVAPTGTDIYSNPVTWAEVIPFGFAPVYRSFAYAKTTTGTGLNSNTLVWSKPQVVIPMESTTVDALLYQWAMSAPSVATLSSTFTWSTLSHAYVNQGSWEEAIPTNPETPGIQLWVAKKTFSDYNGVTETELDWSDASVYSLSLNGLAGLQSVDVKAYKWSATIPSGPTGTETYTWATGSISGYPSGWTATAGTGTAGYTLYEARVHLTADAATPTSSINWGLASLFVAGYAGADGLSYKTAYTASPTLTATPGGTTTSGPTSVPAVDYGVIGTWSLTVPSLSTSDFLYQVDGIYNPATNIITWGTPYWSSLKVGSLSAIVANLGTITAGNITLDTSGYIRGGQTAYDTGTGFWAGYSGGAYKFSVGDGTKGFKWDGTDYDIVGGGNSKMRIGQTAYNTGTGLWVGMVSGVPKISMGIAGGAGFTFDGTSFVITGGLQAGSITAASGIIADAAVTTLKLAGNSVTIPVYTEVLTSGALTSLTANVAGTFDVISSTIVLPAAANLMIAYSPLPTIVLESGYSSGSDNYATERKMFIQVGQESSNVNGAAYAYAEVYVNGTLTGTPIIGGTQDFNGAVWYGLFTFSIPAFTRVLSLAAGTYTIAIKLRYFTHGGNAYYQEGPRSLVLSGVMR